MRNGVHFSEGKGWRSGGRIWLMALLMPVLFPAAVLAQYRFDSWTTENGLPQNSINGLAQTPDGYLWMTTFDGLVRFDGVRFTIFVHSNTPGLATNRLTALYADREGTLWIGTEDSGVIRYRSGVFTTFTKEQGLPHNAVSQIQQDSQGTLVVVTHTGLVRWAGDKFILIPDSFLHSFQKVHYGRSGAQWWFDRDGLRQLKDGRQINYPELKARISVNGIRAALCEDRAGNFWLWSYPDGLFCVLGQRIKRFTEKEGMPRVEDVVSIHEDRSGAIWFVTHGAGVVRYQQGRFSAYGREQGLLSDSAQSIIEDREGSLWVGTTNMGLNQLNRQSLTTYSLADGLGDKNIYPIYQDHAGAIWFGSLYLTRFADGRFTNFTEKDFPRLTQRQGLGVQALQEDREGRLWISVIGGLFSFKEGRFTDHSALIAPIVFAIHQDQAGDLWFGTERGLFKLHNGVITRYGVDEGLPSEDVKVIFEDLQHRLWIGTYGGLARVTESGFVCFTVKDGLKSNRVRSLYEDADGDLWIGTYDGGLNRLKNGQIVSITTENGLYNNGVFQILEDRRGNFWMSCNKGIYRVSHRQLVDFAEGRILRVISRAYGKRDGMLNDECNGGRQPAGIRARDGRLWFPTQDGAVMVDPEAEPINELPPPVLIEAVTLDRANQPFTDSTEITIRPGQGNLEIGYTALSYLKSEQIQFKYKLSGQNWVEAGTRRIAYFSYLPPGNYAFTVIAANSDGVWNEQGASLRLTVIPPFYRTWWFTALAALTLAGLAVAFYRWRISQLKQEHAQQTAFSRRLIDSQETERKRIAAELHDSLGQNLIVIKNQAVLSLHSLDDREEMIEQINSITAAASQAIQEMKEISHNLRPYLLDRLGLTLALESMLKKVAASGQVHFTTEIERIDNLFPKESEIHLYRLVQESVNNILKHADATEARVFIRKEARLVVLAIEDNGKGFDSSLPKTGFGLTGIVERTRLLGGGHSLESEPGKGTRVRIEIPCGSKPL